MITNKQPLDKKSATVLLKNLDAIASNAEELDSEIANEIKQLKQELSEYAFASLDNGGYSGTN